MKKILVATDFSPAALNAAKYAAQMAMAINAELVLLHVYGIPIVYGEIPSELNIGEDRIEVEKNIAELEKQLTSETNGKIEISSTIRMGAFFQELKTVCAYLHPYTVVLGTQGAGARETLFFGSLAVHAMKHLTWPLITVPPNATFSSVKKIALACDLNKVIGDTPIEEIKMMVHDFNAELHVINTGKEKIFDPNTIFEPGMIQDVLEDLRPVYDLTSNNNTDESILRFAEENNIDLLMILPKRHSFFESLIRKSHTRHFVLHSHVPVMALHKAY